MLTNLRTSGGTSFFLIVDSQLKKLTDPEWLEWTMKTTVHFYNRSVFLLLVSIVLAERPSSLQIGSSGEVGNSWIEWHKQPRFHSFDIFYCASWGERKSGQQETGRRVRVKCPFACNDIFFCFDTKQVKFYQFLYKSGGMGKTVCQTNVYKDKRF